MSILDKLHNDRVTVIRSVVVTLNSSSQEYKLFVGLNVDIKQNDLLKITRKADGAIYMFKASKPLAYNIIKHKEIVLTEVSENEVDYGA